MIRKLNERIKNLNHEVILSVHCHNDMGLAAANTLMAVKNGADKVECTINGIGERAGNTALEEVVMGIQMRKDYYDAFTNIKTKEIIKTSRLVTNLMGLDVQVNKAITGENAFAHSSGIHQDGLLKSREVYEIITPEDVGAEPMELILTARSGRHAFKNALAKLGFSSSSDEQFENLFASFLKLADLKKEVYHNDLAYLIEKDGYESKHQINPGIGLFELVSLQVVSNDIFPTAAVKIKRGQEILQASANGDGPVDALYSAIKSLVQMDLELQEYKISSVSRGKEALGRVSLKLLYQGRVYSARAFDTDIIKASALAFLNGVNEILITQSDH